MSRYAIFAIALFGAGTAQAEIQAETRCYAGPTPNKDSGGSVLIFRRYVDRELNKEVGAFVQYNNKETIPLVFNKHVDTDSDDPELGNYEDTRIEIIGKKVTGEYTFVQTGAGIRQGSFVRYTSAKTCKSVIFQYTGDGDSSCKVNY